MNTLAQFFKPEVVAMLATIIAIGVLAGKGKLPTVASFITFCNAINTRGGNIVLLSLMLLIFNAAAVKYLYFVVGLEISGKLTKESAIALTGLTYVTGQICGNVMGAWLKALSPQDMPTPGSTTATTTSTVTPVPPVTPPAVPPQPPAVPLTVTPLPPKV